MRYCCDSVSFAAHTVKRGSGRREDKGRAKAKFRLAVQINLLAASTIASFCSSNESSWCCFLRDQTNGLSACAREKVVIVGVVGSL